MTTGFRRSRGGGAHAHFEDVEARMLASLAAQVVELLRDGAARPGAVAEDPDAVDPLATLVGLGADGPLPRPDDPVLARLLPDGYGDDQSEAADAADFRRYTEPGLRDLKATNAATVVTSLLESGADLSGLGSERRSDDPGDPGDPDDPDDPGDGGPERATGVDVELDADAVDGWLRCLTDIRLALGTRLGVEQDDEERWAQLPDDDPDKAMHEVYDWLAFVQETLLRTLR